MIYLLGKSGAGKDCIRYELEKRGMRCVIPCTTRPKRAREDVKIYHYLTKDEFLSDIKHEKFACWNAYVVANGQVWYYGIRNSDMKGKDIAVINPYWIPELKDLERTDSIFVYLDVSEKTMQSRLQVRGGDRAENQRRILSDRHDFAGMRDKVDFVIRNDMGISPERIADMIQIIWEQAHSDA